MSALVFDELTDQDWDGDGGEVGRERGGHEVLVSLAPIVQLEPEHQTLDEPVEHGLQGDRNH